ncbi:hypothetical protein TRFO_12209 [Tritrichomonas foetus]|uniref:CEP76/DRC7 peptidase-like domain-containing protein n=1 Tax=Tritrichomonas foetus TaxID=1144522 RepID=A0A1J4J5C6_9EUKA|nr:hypothetical protein TRFO_12209 [Tritrichomonas foetus]|eukprot:OHS92851.1 hypothetical protein TRFO_12209 [Tritrichomonas foetus]
MSSSDDIYMENKYTDSFKEMYKRYTLTLDDLRDQNNQSFQSIKYDHAKTTPELAYQQSLLEEELKTQLLKILEHNRKQTNIEEAAFCSVSTEDDLDEQNEIPVTNEIITFRGKIKNDNMNPICCEINKISKTEDNFNPLLSQTEFINSGHYSNEIPLIKADNFRRIEKRLELADTQRKHYFDTTGNIINDKPTLRQIPPPFLDQKNNGINNNDQFIFLHNDPNKKNKFLPASIWGIENSNSAREIRVEVSKIRFTSHNLSSEQDLLQSKMLTLFQSFTNDLNFPRSEYFMERIKALRKEIKKSPHKRASLLKEIIECYELRDLEEQKVIVKRDELVDTWHKLKENREHNKNTTSAVLKWHSKKFSEEEKSVEKRQFSEYLDQRAREIKAYEELNGINTYNLKEIINNLKLRHKEMGLRKPGETLWIPTLTECEKTEYSSLPLREQERFQKLCKTRVSISFMMGTNEVRSDEVLLDSNFIAEPDVGCHAIALHPPVGVKIHIYQSDQNKQKEIANIIIPVLNGEQPNFAEYEFTSETPLKDGRMLAGFVEARCFIEPDPESLFTQVIDTRQIGKMKVHRNLRMTTKMMTELIEKHDPNDPYLTAAISSLVEKQREDKLKSHFSLDDNTEATLFASMAATDIYRQLPNRVYDIAQPASPQPNIESQVITRSLHDIVTEPQIPSFFSFLSKLFGIFGKSKHRIAPEDALSSHMLDPNAKIILHLKNIIQVPKRSKFSFQEKEKLNSRIFAKISLQDVSYVTSAIMDKGDSEFNIKIELKLIKDGSPILNYYDIEDKTIRIDLMDKFSDDENQYLSSIQIPLRSIFVNKKVFGTFSLTSPPFMFDHNTNDELTRLTLNMSMSPPIMIDNDTLPLPIAENKTVSERAYYFWNKLRSFNRRYAILVMNSSGKSVLPCRLITQQNIPVINNHIYYLSYISLIPLKKTLSKLEKVWHTPQEMLDANIGSSIEHAILFCNLLLGQNKDAFVVVGNDIICGYSAFVLLLNSEEEKMELYDPSSASIYDVRSSDCTLIDVSTVFNDGNIWFNIQDTGFPCQLNWDLSNKNCWLPFFDVQNKYQDYPAFQISDLVASPPNKQHKNRIVNLIRSMVKDCVCSIRDKDTYWSRSIEDHLYRLLKNRKKAVSDNSEQMQQFEQLMDKIQEKFKDFRIVGSPFYVSYVYHDNESSIEQLREKIINELIHRDICSLNDNTLFGRAVEIKPYPNNVFAIWVIVVALHPLNGDYNLGMNDELSVNPESNNPLIEEEEEEAGDIHEYDSIKMDKSYNSSYNYDSDINESPQIGIEEEEEEVIENEENRMTRSESQRTEISIETSNKDDSPPPPPLKIEIASTDKLSNDNESQSDKKSCSNSSVELENSSPSSNKEAISSSHGSSSSPTPEHMNFDFLTKRIKDLGNVIESRGKILLGEETPETQNSNSELNRISNFRVDTSAAFELNDHHEKHNKKHHSHQKMPHNDNDIIKESLLHTEDRQVSIHERTNAESERDQEILNENQDGNNVEQNPKPNEIVKKSRKSKKIKKTRIITKAQLAQNLIQHKNTTKENPHKEKDSHNNDNSPLSNSKQKIEIDSTAAVKLNVFLNTCSEPVANKADISENRCSSNLQKQNNDSSVSFVSKNEMSNENKNSSAHEIMILGEYKAPICKDNESNTRVENIDKNNRPIKRNNEKEKHSDKGIVLPGVIILGADADELHSNDINDKYEKESESNNLPNGGEDLIISIAKDSAEELKVFPSLSPQSVRYKSSESPHKHNLSDHFDNLDSPNHKPKLEQNIKNNDNNKDKEKEKENNHSNLDNNCEKSPDKNIRKGIQIRPPSKSPPQSHGAEIRRKHFHSEKENDSSSSKGIKKKVKENNENIDAGAALKKRNVLSARRNRNRKNINHKNQSFSSSNHDNNSETSRKQQAPVVLSSDDEYF